MIATAYFQTEWPKKGYGYKHREIKQIYNKSTDIIPRRRYTVFVSLF